MIGYYGYTVELTYMGVISAMVGIFIALKENVNTKYAIICLMISGICDMLDGPIARTKKNRSDREKKYGIQIDSLTDVVCFGVLPVIIGYSLGLDRTIHILIMSMYVLAAIIRLAFFNVTEMELQQEKIKRTHYLGLPVTSVAAIIPIAYSVCIFFDLAEHLPMVYSALLVIISFAFLTKIKIPKIGWRTIIILCVLAIPVIYFIATRRGYRG